MNRETFLNQIGDFAWGFGMQFLITTENGMYIWNDPDYGGDNTIKPWKGDPKNFVHPGNGGRSKGRHRIGSYCGDKVKLIGIGE